MKVVGSLEPPVCMVSSSRIEKPFTTKALRTAILQKKSNSWNYRSMKIYHVYLKRVSLSFILSSRSHIFSLSLLAFLLHFLLLRLFQFTIHNGEQEEEQYVKYYIAERQHTKPKETVLHGQVLVVFLYRLENITLL
jgi:hypothetical protein